MAEQAKCGLCGEPMPAGEETFQYHGYSGPCPAKSAEPIPDLKVVVRELVDAGNAAIKGDYSDWDTVVPKALEILKREQEAKP